MISIIISAPELVERSNCGSAYNFLCELADILLFKKENLTDEQKEKIRKVVNILNEKQKNG